MAEQQPYNGEERRANPWVPFDCEKHCPQHGRYDQRLQSVEEENKAAKKERAAMRDKSEERHIKVWNEIDKIKEDHEDDLKSLSKDNNRRIGEKIPIKHGIAAIVIILSIFGWMQKTNTDANKRVAEVQAASGQKIEDKLDKLSNQVISMAATAEAEKRAGDNQTAMILEFRRMSEAMIDAIEKLSENRNDEAREREK